MKLRKILSTLIFKRLQTYKKKESRRISMFDHTTVLLHEAVDGLKLNQMAFMSIARLAAQDIVWKL